MNKHTETGLLGAKMLTSVLGRSLTSCALSEEEEWGGVGSATGVWQQTTVADLEVAFRL